MDTAAERVDFLYNRMEKLEGRLNAYQEIEKEIRENVEKLDGLHHKIAKLRFIDGMTYQEIADKLGYSYGYIRKVVSQGNKEVTTTLVKA